MKHSSPHHVLAAVSMAAALLWGPMVGAQAQTGLRPEVGRPLQAAQELIKAQRFKEALAKVREAEAVGARTAYENDTIERMRLAAASSAGDLIAASASFEALNGSGRLPQADKLRYLESLTGSAYRAKDYGRTAQWGQRYHQEGGNSPAVRTLLIQAQYLSGDFAGAAKQLTTELQASEKAGGPPSEERLKLMLNAAARLDNTEQYVFAVEKLLTYYPKKEYWGDLLSRLQRKPNFSERFALDTYRLALATGSLRGADDYLEMAQLAAQAGFPAEGKQVLDKGYAAGVLGAGADADRHRRLSEMLARRTQDDQATRAAAEAQALASSNGEALVKLGLNVALSGDSAKGLNLMQQGLNKGGLKAAETSKLRYGIAQALSGNAHQARAIFRTVKGTDGAADLARLWALFARNKSPTA